MNKMMIQYMYIYFHLISCWWLTNYSLYDIRLQNSQIFFLKISREIGKAWPFV